MKMRHKKETIGNGAWPDRRGRARVLVENAGGAERLALNAILAGAGYDVSVCPGPDTSRGLLCPLVEDGGCRLAQGADVVLNSLSLSRPESRDVVRCLRSQVPDTPVIVEVPTPRATRYADILEGCQVEPFPMTSGRVRQAVSQVTPKNAQWG